MPKIEPNFCVNYEGKFIGLGKAEQIRIENFYIFILLSENAS